MQAHIRDVLFIVFVLNNSIFFYRHPKIIVVTLCFFYHFVIPVLKPSRNMFDIQLTTLVITFNIYITYLSFRR